MAALLKNNGNLIFIKEVAKYFMDFLETDFHKRKAPRSYYHLIDESLLFAFIKTF